jgi:phosphoglycerate dehydrogenase-like enzyme
MRRLNPGFVVLYALFWPLAASGSQPDPQATEVIAELGLRAGVNTVAESMSSEWKPARVVVSLPPYLPQILPDIEQQFRTAAGDVEIVFDTSDAMVPSNDLMKGADALIGDCTPRVFDAVDDSFAWLHNYFVGMDRCANPDKEQVEGRLFSNGKRSSGPAIAEHVIAMMLSLIRGLPVLQRSQIENRWDPSPAYRLSFGELKGKTLLVAGLGGIGTEVARRAHALGMRIIATRNSSREGPDFVEYVGLGDELGELATQANVVVNALPLTAKTANLFDRDFFSAMPQGSIFISVGRGGSIVTADLVKALEDRHLYGAGLDVTDPEPLPPESPLWQMSNVIFTPHVAAAGVDSIRRMAIIAVENLRRYVAGEALLNVVDMSRGY